MIFIEREIAFFKMFFGNKKKSHREPDKIWQTKTAKYEGLCIEVAQLNSTGFDVVIVAHFKKTLEEIRTALDSKGLSYKFLHSSMDLELLRQGSMNKLSVMLSEMIPERPADPTETGSDKRTYVIAGEHYPLVERDQKLIDWAESFATTVCFFDSLETPFLKLFGIDNVTALLDRLGGDKNSFLSHAFISSAIENAQKKLAKKVNGDLSSDSAENWIAINYSANQ